LLNVERNPIDLVEVKGISKRKKRPQVLQVKDAWQILDALVQPFRTIVLIGLCFGLRISEILGLRWTDFDFKRSVVLIQRSAVGKRLNKPREFSTVATLHFIFDGPQLKLRMPKRQFVGRTSPGTSFLMVKILWPTRIQTSI
jgi:integrase